MSTVSLGATYTGQGAFAAYNQAMANSAQGFIAYSRAVADAEKANRRFELSVRGIGQLISSRLYSRGITELISTFKLFAERSVEIQTRTAQIITIADKGALSFDAWAASTKRLSNEFATPSLDIVKAKYEAISNQIVAGAEASLFMSESIELAVATASNVKITSDLLATTANAFGDAATAAQKYSDIIFKVVELGRVQPDELGTLGRTAVSAASLGIDLKEVGAGIALLTQQGNKPNVALTLLTNTINKLIKPSIEMNDLFNEWGVSSAEAAVQTFGFLGIIRKLQDEYQKGGLTRLGDLAKDLRAIQGTIGLIRGTNFGNLSDVYNMIDADGATNKAFQTATDTEAFKYQQRLTETTNTLIDFGVSLTKLSNDLAKTGVTLNTVLESATDGFIAATTPLTIFSNTLGLVPGVGEATGTVLKSLGTVAIGTGGAFLLINNSLNLTLDLLDRLKAQGPEVNKRIKAIRDAAEIAKANVPLPQTESFFRDQALKTPSAIAAQETLKRFGTQEKVNAKWAAADQQMAETEEKINLINSSIANTQAQYTQTMSQLAADQAAAQATLSNAEAANLLEKDILAKAIGDKDKIKAVKNLLQQRTKEITADMKQLGSENDVINQMLQAEQNLINSEKEARSKRASFIATRQKQGESSSDFAARKKAAEQASLDAQAAVVDAQASLAGRTLAFRQYEKLKQDLAKAEQDAKFVLSQIDPQGDNLKQVIQAASAKVKMTGDAVKTARAELDKITKASNTSTETFNNDVTKAQANLAKAVEEDLAAKASLGGALSAQNAVTKATKELEQIQQGVKKNVQDAEQNYVSTLAKIDADALQAEQAMARRLQIVATIGMVAAATGAAAAVYQVLSDFNQKALDEMAKNLDDYFKVLNNRLQKQVDALRESSTQLLRKDATQIAIISKWRQSIMESVMIPGSTPEKSLTAFGNVIDKIDNKISTIRAKADQDKFSSGMVGLDPIGVANYMLQELSTLYNRLQGQLAQPMNLIDPKNLSDIHGTFDAIQGIADEAAKTVREGIRQAEKSMRNLTDDFETRQFRFSIGDKGNVAKIDMEVQRLLQLSQSQNALDAEKTLERAKEYAQLATDRTGGKKMHGLEFQVFQQQQQFFQNQRQQLSQFQFDPTIIGQDRIKIEEHILDITKERFRIIEEQQTLLKQDQDKAQQRATSLKQFDQDRTKLMTDRQTAVQNFMQQIVSEGLVYDKTSWWSTRMNYASGLRNRYTGEMTSTNTLDVTDFTNAILSSKTPEELKTLLGQLQQTESVKSASTSNAFFNASLTENEMQVLNDNFNKIIELTKQLNGLPEIDPITSEIKSVTSAYEGFIQANIPQQLQNINVEFEASLNNILQSMQQAAILLQQNRPTPTAGNFARGGLVNRLIGTDRASINVSGGEFVSNPFSTSRNLGTLIAMNSNRQNINNTNHYNISVTASPGNTIGQISRELRRGVARGELRLS